MKPLRVLHCPTIVGGNPQGLARAERKIGLQSWSVALQNRYFAYPCDEILWQEKNNYFTREVKRWKLLWRALKDFDVIHFNFGRSILPHWIPAAPLCGNEDDFFSEKRNAWLMRKLYRTYALLFSLRDIPLLKKAGKGIVVTYQGNDARQFDYCRHNFQITFAHEREYEHCSNERDAQRRRQIDFFSRYADRIYALNPDLLHVLPQKAQFMPYAHIDLEHWQASRKDERNSHAPVIVHAPTNRTIKGTPYILDAVKRLKSEGIIFDFILVENISQSQARTVYERADIAIDQLLTGWYGGLAVELMALGKPVICYIRENDLKFIPEQMRKDLPLINATPHTIYDVLKEWLILRRAEWPLRGAASRQYVETWHNPLKIAEALKTEYEKIMHDDGQNRTRVE